MCALARRRKYQRHAKQPFRSTSRERRTPSLAMNVPLYDGMGLRIYRELMHRESRCAADWHVNYGPEALQRNPDPMTMINLGKFSKFAAVPMPIDVQRAMKREG